MDEVLGVSAMAVDTNDSKEDGETLTPRVLMAFNDENCTITNDEQSGNPNLTT